MTTKPPFGADLEPRLVTQQYHHPPVHSFPPVSECSRGDLVTIAERSLAGAGWELLGSQSHIDAICRLVGVQHTELAAARTEISRLTSRLTAANLAIAVLHDKGIGCSGADADGPGLHVAALDYAARQDDGTSALLMMAAHGATASALRATGEIVPRAALLLIDQLASDPCRCGSDRPRCERCAPVPAPDEEIP